MSASNNTPAKKTSWWQGVKAEFKKIIWPDKPTLVKETIAVIVTTFVMAMIIMLIDWLVKYGLDFIL
ncbi:MAG: preprotein translocase subunit SecE [Lachnospiraceae bacterium]|nr:preprotein translocase subunit SecE [Lachnospiraceae bacterium]